MIPYGRQDITRSDINAVIEVLESDYLTQGPTVPSFEKVVADYCGAAHAVAMNSATSALHTACMTLGLGPGDWLWTSPITFVASANCALYCGAQVDFVDIGPHSYNISPQALEAKLIKAKREGCLPKIVIPVHLAGQSCDMQAIHSLSQKYGFRIIEDASHAIGGKYLGAPIGNSQFSDITIFSFHPVKIITTAEGGMALTNDDSLSERMRLLRTHGITRNTSEMEKEPDGPWYYEQVALGYNYRMSDLHAALGLSQMERLGEYVFARHQIAQRYNELLADLPLTLPWQHPDAHSAFHLYIVRLKLDAITLNRRAVFDALRAANIGVNVHYIPVYLQPYYQQMGFKADQFPEAENYYSEAISLPMYPRLTEMEQDHVVQALRRVLVT